MVKVNYAAVNENGDVLDGRMCHIAQAIQNLVELENIPGGRNLTVEYYINIDGTDTPYHEVVNITQAIRKLVDFRNEAKVPPVRVKSRINGHIEYEEVPE